MTKPRTKAANCGLPQDLAETIRKDARLQYQDEGSVEIDEGAPLSRSPDSEGCYVQAWVYVEYPDAAAYVAYRDETEAAGRTPQSYLRWKARQPVVEAIAEAGA